MIITGILLVICGLAALAYLLGIVPLPSSHLTEAGGFLSIALAASAVVIGAVLIIVGIAT